MNHIFIPTSSSEDWRKFLAKPSTQWRSGYSAKELAECWEDARGLPREIKEMFLHSDIPELVEPELLLAIPEYQVKLPGGLMPSQNDLFVLARTKSNQLVVMMIEAKVAEPFGERIEDWLKDASPGKQVRLRYMTDLLGLNQPIPSHIRYQLIHRTASAIIESRRYCAKYALMMVQSFSSNQCWFNDYQDFLSLFSITGKPGHLIHAASLKELDLVFGWVFSPI